MKRNKIQYSFDILDIKNIKEKVLRFIADSDTFSYFDTNEYQIAPNRYELLAAKDVHAQGACKDTCQDWVMGHQCFESTTNGNEDNQEFQAAASYIPTTVIFIKHGSNVLEIESYEADGIVILEDILNAKLIPAFEISATASFHTPVSKEQYLQTILQIQEDIYVGKYYEINYCIPYFLHDVAVDPLLLFHYQNRLNPSPMAAFYRQGDNYLIGTSPERFLYKASDKIYCQPIKGTAPKTIEGLTTDQIKNQLRASEKDRAENVMIVDLTRSDLSKCCMVNSVKVPELFGIYEFPYVFQMISTISGTLKKGMDFNKIMTHTFPMGSMTGAPKSNVIRHIQQYETVKRGIYSGTVFYINPEGDFDSNVVIRSLVYNVRNRILQFQVGGAITYDSIPEQEWEELSWKAYSMKKSMTS